MAYEYPETLAIEPSPRILQMLGHVNFEGWQCLAELIDNSIDAFLRDAELGDDAGARRIDVELPSYNDLNDGSAIVEVRDNAHGMSLDQMQDAVRAGYSGNDPVGKLGLFGMGFNVATARLGRITEILSHRPGDAQWIGLRIDVDEMVRNRTWNAPVIREPLSERDGESGTKVRITQVPRQGVVRSMIWGAAKPALLRKLSRLYHVAMGRHGVEIRVAGATLVPWRLCLWSDDRSVPSQAWGRVPAVFQVDELLEPLPYCMNCWEWGTPDQIDCLLCGQPMVVRDRRIKGVLGIQRSFSIAWGEGELNHYGVDLIRNGRVIETFDKDFFEYINPDDPSDRELDYPVDGTFLGGRIVGELEIDFVPLRSYHKDSFEKSDPAWTEVRRRLRGDTPLRPDIARRKGFDRPDTIVARLFDGYRKVSPAGERHLITGHPPGRKKNARDPMHTSAELQEWIQGFENGLEEYQSDAKWWEAVQWAERTEVEDTDGTATSVFDVPESDPGAGEEDESADERDSGRPTTIPDSALSLTVDTAGITRNAPSQLVVRAEKVTHGSLADDRPLLVDPRGGEILFVWDPRHQDFRQGLLHPVDCLVLELAMQVMYRAQVTQRDYPLSTVTRAIAQRAFPERGEGLDAAAERATGLLQDVRIFLIERLAELAPHDIELDEVEMLELRRSAAAAGIAGTSIDDLLRTGEFVRHMPLVFVPRTAQLFPAILMGTEGFFALDYEGYDTEELRKELRETLYINLSDVAWLVEERPNLGGVLTDLSRLQLQKSVAALDIMQLRRRS